ncbi:MAG: SDR family NAD(P)-dependent oxidoreductase [Solirubrobacterales bacterium]
MEERTAIITGGGGDIGRAIGAELHRRGARVLLADLDERGAAAASEIDPDGARALGIECDVQERAAVERAFERVEDEWGRVDILVNNAGLQIMRSFWEIEDTEWEDVLAVNLRGTLYGCQIGGARMREQGWGRIVNHASIAGQQGGLVMGAHYAASKAGILVLTKIAAGELAPHGVTVNAIAPAAIEGRLVDGLEPERIEALEARIPVGRLGRPEEVAAAAAWLASEEAGYVTGTTIDLNGGVFMR